MKQWYQGKLTERLMQAGAMAKDRALLRRGSRKMQDGTLGERSDNAVENDAMNIHIGDVVVSQSEQTPPPSPVQEVARPNIAPAAGAWGPLRKAIFVAGLLSAGTGLGMLIGASDEPVPPAPVAHTDTNTQYELIIGSEE